MNGVGDVHFCSELLKAHEVIAFADDDQMQICDGGAKLSECPEEIVDALVPLRRCPTAHRQYYLTVRKFRRRFELC